jgi:tetratricopeptide (TPR) repeat protein
VLEQLVCEQAPSSKLLVQAAAALDTPRPQAETETPRVMPDPYATAFPLFPDHELPAKPHMPGYEILKELGRGGMGVVYLARQTQLNRLVALKMMLSGAFASKEDLQRFRAEAEAVAQLQHPHIVQIYEIGTLEGLPYFSFEYLAGGSLAHQLRGRPLPARTAVTLLRPLAEAMHSAHLKGILHRDLKPANILLTLSRAPQAPAEDTSSSPALDKVTPKITDFGLAKRFDSDTSPTRTGVVMGSPDYMAPEQAKGLRQLGPGVDIYALGAMLYEMVTGRPPFRGVDPLDTVMRVVTEDPVPPSHLTPTLPPDLETICLKCLHKEPTRRFLSAQELADDLQRFLQGEPIRARRVGTVERTLKWARRKPALAGLLVTVLLAVVGLALAVMLLWQSNLREAALREQAEANERKAMSNQKKADRAVNDLFVAVTETDLLQQETMREVRQLLLEKALPYFQEFRAERGNYPALLAETATNQGRVGLIRAERGEWEKAREAFQEALPLWRQVVAAHSDEVEAQKQLAWTWYHLGQAQENTSHYQEAAQSYGEALTLLTALVKRQPDQSTLRAELAAAQTSQAQLYSNLGQNERAAAVFAQALQNIQQLLVRHPAEPLYQANLASVWNDLGNLQRRQGQNEQAEASFRAALKLQEKLAATSPDLSRYRFELAITHSNLGLLLTDQGRWEDAKNHFQQALRLETPLVEQYPRVVRFRKSLSILWINLGRLQMSQRRFTDALASYEAARPVLAKLIQEFPTDQEYQIGLGAVLCNLGILYRETRRPTEALPWLDQAIRQLQTVLDKESRHAQARQFLRNAYQGRAAALDDLQRHAESAQAWEQAMAYDDQKLIDFRIQWIRNLALGGNPARALTEAEKIRAAPMPAALLVELAHACVQVHALTQDDTSQGERGKTLALELLTRAAKAGYFRTAAGSTVLRQEPFLGTFSSHPQFQKLLADAEAARQH